MQLRAPGVDDLDVALLEVAEEEAVVGVPNGVVVVRDGGRVLGAGLAADQAGPGALGQEPAEIVCQPIMGNASRFISK